jgi:glycosyltransferase involved in cell wall biosynthesis
VKKILYITYDGLTDPLGQSQILPYLKGLSRYGYQFTILSFEKKDRLLKEAALVKKLTEESGIEWVPLSFTTKPPLLSKFYDAIRMKRKAFALHREKGFHMVHCRSYIAADVGLAMKKRFGVLFFFDMRGFWADEKKDGSWDVSKPLFARIYKYYKEKETEYLAQADQIISLTESAKAEMLTWPQFDKRANLQVIPCCADMELFSLVAPGEKEAAKKRLNITGASLTLSYLGSVGTWYMLDEMRAFFKQLKITYPSARFLFITHSDPELILSKAASLDISRDDIIITEASRSQVPLLLQASDINISFIKPVYSKISSSPTKLGEVLSMGIPVITNSGVGDVERIVKNADAGCVIHGFTQEDFAPAIESIPALMQKSPATIRSQIKELYSLDNGIALYAKCYEHLLK